MAESMQFQRTALPAENITLAERCDLKSEINGRYLTNYSQLKDAVREKAHNIIKDRNIEKFIVGKTYGYSNDKLRGLTEMSRFYYENGYSSITGFAIVRDKNIASGEHSKLRQAEQLALALEGDLIRYYAYDNKNKKIANNSLQAGGMTGNTQQREESQQQSQFFVIYVAIKRRAQRA